MCGLLLYIKSIKTTLCQLWQWLENSPKRLAAFLKVQVKCQECDRQGNKSNCKKVEKSMQFTLAAF